MKISFAFGVRLHSSAYEISSSSIIRDLVIKPQGIVHIDATSPDITEVNPGIDISKYTSLKKNNNSVYCAVTESQIRDIRDPSALLNTDPGC